MKTSRILLLAASAMLFGACNKEEISGSSDTTRLVPMTFTASSASQTRTQLTEGNAVHWNEGDRIAIWDGTNKNEFTTGTVNGSGATFTGMAAEAENYIAFYPFDAVTSINATSIKFTVPAQQTAVPGTFAQNLAPSWAQNTDGGTSLQFHNLCALVKFTVAEEMAGEGTFTFVGGNATEELAGDLTYTIGDGSVTATETRVSLSGNFEAGSTYYIVVAPQALENGFSLLYEDSKSKLYRRATGNLTTLKAGQILNLGGMSLDKFDAAIMKELANIGTENNDGTRTLNESQLNTVKNTQTLTPINSSLKSAAGIGHYEKLTSLDCSWTSLTSLNVSGLLMLKKLNCSLSDRLTSLNVSGLTNLETLDIPQCNKLTSLNVSGLTSLKTLDISQCTKLTSLDVSGLTNLETLDCHSTGLTEIDVNKCTNLVTLDISQCTHLTELNVSELSKLTSLDCSGCSSLSNLNYSEKNTALESFNCSNCNLTELDLSKMTRLNRLTCSKNQLSELDLRGLTMLANLDCSENNLHTLNLDDQGMLTSLSCNINCLSEVDITQTQISSTGSIFFGRQFYDEVTDYCEYVNVYITSAQYEELKGLRLNGHNSGVILKVKPDIQK